MRKGKFSNKTLLAFFIFLLLGISFLLRKPAVTQAANTGCPGSPPTLPGSTSTGGDTNLIPPSVFTHPTDVGAPQFSTIVEGVSRPRITSVARLNGDYRPSDAPSDFATLVGLECISKNVLVPQSGYGGVTVLYADANSVTLKYGIEDNIACGYTLYLEGFSVKQEVISLYNELTGLVLPRLEPGYRIGTCSSDVKVAIRDTGTFLDPRWEIDWWRYDIPAGGRDSGLSQIAITCECEESSEGDYGYTPEGGNPYDAIPMPPPYVPCNETRSGEFHSLRPYQASPCNQNYEDLALFCGNDFILMDTIVINKTYYDMYWGDLGDGAFSDPEYENLSWRFVSSDLTGLEEYCQPNYDYNGDGVSDFNDRACMRIPPICEAIECIQHGDSETCEFTVDRRIPIAVDLKGSELPIMGYTEPSVNSWDPFEVRNTYNQIPESQESLDHPAKVNEYVSWYLNGVIGRNEYGVDDDYEVVNFSGPLKRLLSFESQIVSRAKEVEKAGDVRHDQLAGSLRLSYWADKLPPLRSAFETLEDYLNAFEEWRDNYPWPLFSLIPFSSTEDRRGLVNLESYDIQPISTENTSLICSRIVDQVPADLFFSHMQESVELADLLQQIHSPQDANLDAGALNVQLIEYPQCIIAEVRRNPGDNLFPGELTATVEYTADIFCDFFLHGDSRLCEALPGNTACHDLPIDDWWCGAYFNQVDCPNGQFCGRNCTYAFEVCTIIDEACLICNLDNPGECYRPDGYVRCCPGLRCDRYYTEWPIGSGIQVVAGGNCRPGNPVEEESWGSYNAGACTSNVFVSFKTLTWTPLAREAWAKLVSGPYGAFRRIFPQIEDAAGRPIRRLWDIPAEADVLYIASPPVSVVGGAFHHIYFPHIGGIHEYFLNCMQKTLRPQGFGQGCVTAPIFPPAAPASPGSPPPPGPPVPPPSSEDGCCTATYAHGGSVTFCIDAAGDVWLFNNTAYWFRDPQIAGACQWPGADAYSSDHVCYGYFPGSGSYLAIGWVQGPTPNQLSCTITK